MFTGIIDHCGLITKIEIKPQSQHLWIKHSFTDLMLGESIAVDGICLTVTHFQDDIFCCDISPETCRVTTAENFQVGSQVNLERALQLSSRLGGHIVMGHIEQVCQIKKIQTLKEFTEVYLTGLNEQTKKFIIKKGSVAINGVSLTINEVLKNGFTVMLIPHTLERTNLSELREGNSVNIECDMITRIIVERFAPIAEETQ